MSPNRCATHHICDCRQARLGAAEKEVKRLQGQLEYHHTTCPSNLSSGLKGMQEREATITTLQAQVERLQVALGISIAAIKGEHNELNHDYEHDAVRCPICRMIKEYEALASTPHSAGRRVDKLEALYQSAKILRDTDEEAIVFQVYKDICVHLAALDEAQEDEG